MWDDLREISLLQAAQFDQVVQLVLVGAGKKLPSQIDRKEARTCVYVLLAGHDRLSRRTSPSSLVIPFGSQHNAQMKTVFLQRRLTATAMRRLIFLTLLVSMSASLPASPAGKCESPETPEDLALLRYDLDSLKMRYRIDESRVCVDEADAGRFSNIVLRVFSLSKEDRRLALYLRLIHDRQYEQGFAFLMSRKEAGDRWTLQEIEEWFRPDAPPQMQALGADWLNKAARTGTADAQVQLALQYLQNDKNLERLAEAVRLLDSAADQGHQYALFVLSQMNGKALQSRGITSKYVRK